MEAKSQEFRIILLCFFRLKQRTGLEVEQPGHNQVPILEGSATGRGLTSYTTMLATSKAIFNITSTLELHDGNSYPFHTLEWSLIQDLFSSLFLMFQTLLFKSAFEEDLPGKI